MRGRPSLPTNPSWNDIDREHRFLDEKSLINGFLKSRPGLASSFAHASMGRNKKKGQSKAKKAAAARVEALIEAAQSGDVGTIHALVGGRETDVTLEDKSACIAILAAAAGIDAQAFCRARERRGA